MEVFQPDQGQDGIKITSYKKLKKEYILAMYNESMEGGNLSANATYLSNQHMTCEVPTREE